MQQQDAPSAALERHFPWLAPHVRAALEAEGQLRRFTAGTVLYEEGFPCPWVPFVLEGVARVFKVGENGREITLYRVAPGQVCVLSSSCVVTGAEARVPAIVSAESDLALLAVPADRFRTLTERHPELQRYMNEALTQRLAEMMMVVDEVAFGRVDLRLADRLLRAIGSAASGEVPLTHAQLAVELGSAREVVSRILKDFEHRGWVRLGRGRVEVLDGAALRTFTERGGR